MTLPRHSYKRWLALLVLLPLTGCDDAPGKPNPNSPDRPVRPQMVMDFVYLFNQNCAACHGPVVHGQPEVGAKGNPAPPLNDPLFLAIVPDDVLRHVIARGRPGTLMAAFGDAHGGSLTSEQVDLLASEIRKRWGGTKPKLPSPLPNYLVSGGGSVQRGEKVFGMACAVCHGEKGEGTSKAQAINDPAFLALLSDQALQRIIITGRPDLKNPMPNYAERGPRDEDFSPLTNRDITDLVALLASWRERGTRARP
jgi:mono/diheme cytochrome c family protein